MNVKAELTWILKEPMVTSFSEGQKIITINRTSVFHTSVGIYDFLSMEQECYKIICNVICNYVELYTIHA